MTDWDAKSAEWYAENFGEYATNRVAIDALTVDASTDIVDVGCGTGAALRHAAARVTEGLLVGVDPVPRMVEIAKERAADHAAGDRLRFLVGSATECPLDDNTVDLALAFDSFDYWGDHVRGLKEIERVVRPGGRLAIVKDGGVPDGDDMRRSLETSLNQSAWSVEREEVLEGEGCKLTLWVLRAPI